MSEQKKNLNRWSVIAGGLMVQVVLGTVYAFSVFVRPLETEFGWDRTTTQWAFSIALATFAIVMIPAGRLQDRIGPRKVASIGGVLLGLSFLLGALVVTESRPWALYLTYGLLGGAGIGFAYVCPIAAAVKWFPDKKGFIAGLSVAGFGAGALFFAGPASVLLLPPNASADPMGIGQIILVGLGASAGTGFGIGWKTFFVLHGIVAGPVVGGVLFDATNGFVTAFVFAGTLCFMAAGCSVVIWGLARTRMRMRAAEAITGTGPRKASPIAA